ncbi:flavin-containing monooxygenase [Candidatus Poriferisocius sp.]|uniref:flavin-containing monooxygenase n=1 Tax=Candidatus Poriferisocius sp. TaxID=3101276 RepID=UPI003B5B4B93
MTERSSSTIAELDFDPVALREKYREERDKRLRADGNDQYIAMDGDFSRYLDDPAQAGIVREPLTDEVDVAIIGAGFSGLLAGARLRSLGVESIRMIDGGAEFGGTWYWNQYPGVQCDIESYIYLPLLEELGYMPKEKYSYGPEILEHCRSLGRHFDLYRDVCFGTRVHEMHWDDADRRWELHTNHHDRMRARFVIMAIGPLSRPKLPGIPGIDTFGGHSFHTSRWDYDYTGGDTNGNLTNLADKVVGVIGTGATAVQCIPHVGEAAQHLYVFQRTPSSIDVRGNRPTDPEWAMSLEPGWQQHRIENFGHIVAGSVQEEDLVSDGWTGILRNLTALGEGARLGTPEEIAEAMEMADFQKMEQIRSRVDELVDDPAVAEALKPYYRQFCKRPCFHDDYLPTFNRPNVTLVDTGGQGVERISPKGVVAGGAEYELDCLIFATGFEVGTDYSHRAGCEIHGRGGTTLSERWRDGMSTYHGVVSRDYPNLFHMGGIQSGVSPNFTELYNEQSRHVAYIIDRGMSSGATLIEPTAQAEADWVRLIVESANRRAGFLESCTPGYYNNEGKPDDGPGWFGGTYGGGAQEFFRLLEAWRDEGALQGLELS